MIWEYQLLRKHREFEKVCFMLLATKKEIKFIQIFMINYIHFWQKESYVCFFFFFFCFFFFLFFWGGGGVHGMVASGHITYSRLCNFLAISHRWQWWYVLTESVFYGVNQGKQNTSISHIDSLCVKYVFQIRSYLPNAETTCRSCNDSRLESLPEIQGNGVKLSKICSIGRP